MICKECKTNVNMITKFHKLGCKIGYRDLIDRYKEDE